MAGITPRRLTRAYVPIMPTTPHPAADCRSEPVVSVASEAKQLPIATAAADPPEDPPVTYSRFHGLRTGPQ